MADNRNATGGVGLTVGLRMEDIMGVEVREQGNLIGGDKVEGTAVYIKDHLRSWRAAPGVVVGPEADAPGRLVEGPSDFAQCRRGLVRRRFRRPLRRCTARC